MAEVYVSEAPARSVQHKLKDHAWTTLLDSTVAGVTIATAKTGSALTGYVRIDPYTETAFKVRYVKNTTTALHVIPVFSMNGSTWEADGNDSNPGNAVELQLDFTTATVYTNCDGVVYRGTKVPFRFMAFLVWWDGVVGADTVKIYGLGASV